MFRPLKWLYSSLIVLSALPALGAPVTLVDNGSPKCCVVVGEEKSFKEPDAFNWAPKTAFLKWAAEDLAAYLGKMSGAKVEIGAKPVEGLIPIYVGCIPEGSDPPAIAKATEYGDAYVVDVTAKRVVLYGESRRAVFYAAAQLLSDLGVRWYAPGDLGEIVPQRKTVTAEAGSQQYAPDFTTRRIWCRPGDELRWMYRNRLGNATIPCGHSMHHYGASLPGWFNKETGKREPEKYPDCYAIVDGKTYQFPNMANPEVARILATVAVKDFREGPRGGQGGKQAKGFISISPDDGYLMDERPEVVAMNSPEREPILGMPSFSDAWFGFLNQVCAEVQKQAPDMEFRFGSLAYMNYLVPPKKTKPDPRIVPVVAPIAFNRYVSIGTKGAPTSELLEEVFKGWSKISPRVGTYFYNFNLADMAMPYTRRVHWTNDIPHLYQWGIRDFTAESHPNWHTMMPGNYVAARLMWDVKTDVNMLLDEYYPAYYGPAAEAMRKYDTTLENAYETTKVFAGAVWGMHLILTPEVMKQLDQSLAEAEKQAKGKGAYEQRVETMRFSLNFGKCWFAARDALNRYDLAEAEKQGAAFIANYKAGFAKYPDFFGKNVPWGPNIERYFELFHNRAFKDAGRVAREGTIVYKIPDELQAHLETVEGGAKPSGRIPDPVKDDWRPLKTFSATLDEQGLTFFRGVIWYRHEFTLPSENAEAAGDKPLRLWMSGVDSKAHVWLNGHDLGEQQAKTMGMLQFDLTPAIERQKKNLLLIAVDNTFPNDIGVGGIIRPAVIYVPKP